MASQPASIAPADTASLPLFPLSVALLPGGLLELRIFEARYLDLISRCLREGSGFGVVALREGNEVRQGDAAITLEDAGCLAVVIDCDASESGLLHVRCQGTRRFELADTAQMQADGLWVAPVQWLPEEPPTPVPETLHRTAHALGEALEQLAAQGVTLHLPPARLDDAVWIAYRWCELLSLSNAGRLTLMRLEDPVARLQTVDHILRQQAAVSEVEDAFASHATSDDGGPATLH